MGSDQKGGLCHYMVVEYISHIDNWCASYSFCGFKPLTYVTASAPKNAKVTRWALALQEFGVSFKYRKGREHVVPDYLAKLNAANVRGVIDPHMFMFCIFHMHW
jgi:hypothetical protein